MAPTSRHILLVEDEPTLQRILGSVLSDAGHEVEAVDSAELAVERLDDASEAEIDLVLSDKNLPEMNGLDLLDHVRAREAKTETSRGFMLVTGYPSRDSALRVLDGGGDGYLVKPFRSLVDAVNDVQRVLDRPRDARQRGHALASQLCQAVTDGAALSGEVEASVLVDERALRVRLEGHLQHAGATLLPAEEAGRGGPRALVAARAGDLVRFAERHPGAALVLVDAAATFEDVVSVIAAGGGRFLDPTRVGAAP
jgi:two-component system response regulator GlrR